MTHLLDQPVWNALVSGNSNLSFGTSMAKYFDEAVSPFVDVEDQGPDNFKLLYETVPHDQPVAIFSLYKDLKVEPWTFLSRIDGLQMIHNGQTQELNNDPMVKPLDSSHVNEMISLTGQTKPGPFSEKTINFGHYYGIFDNNTLVAMAGQRLHPGDFAEISGVCTHPDFTGKGFASKLLQHQIKRIIENNETPFLHVKSENLNAVRIYQSLGFEIRTEIFIHLLKK